MTSRCVLPLHARAATLPAAARMQWAWRCHLLLAACLGAEVQLLLGNAQQLLPCARCAVVVKPGLVKAQEVRVLRSSGFGHEVTAALRQVPESVHGTGGQTASSELKGRCEVDGCAVQALHWTCCRALEAAPATWPSRPGKHAGTAGNPREAAAPVAPRAPLQQVLTPQPCAWLTNGGGGLFGGGGLQRKSREQEG